MTPALTRHRPVRRGSRVGLACALVAALGMPLRAIQQAAPPPAPPAPPSAVQAFNSELIKYLEAQAAAVTGREGSPGTVGAAGTVLGGRRDLLEAWKPEWSGYGQATIMGLIATRDMYVANLTQFGAQLDGYLNLPADQKLALMKRMQARADDFKEAHRRAFLNPGPVLGLTANVQRVLASNRRDFVQMLDQNPLLGLKEGSTPLFEALLTPDLTDAQLLAIGDRYLAGGRDRALEDAKKAQAETAMADLVKYRTARFSRQHEALRAMGTMKDADGNVLLQTPLPGQLADAAAGLVTTDEYWDAFADLTLAMLAGGAWIIPVVGPWISAGAAAIQIIRDGQDVHVRYLEGQAAARTGVVTNPMYVFTQLDRGRAAQRNFFLAYTFGALDFHVLITQLRLAKSGSSAAGRPTAATTEAAGPSGARPAAADPSVDVLARTERMEPPPASSGAAGAAGGATAPPPTAPAVAEQYARGLQKARELGLPADEIAQLERTVAARTTNPALYAGNSRLRAAVWDASRLLSGLAELDTLLARARQLGIPEAEIQAALQRARTANTASSYVDDLGQDLAIIFSNREGRTIIVAADELDAFGRFTARVRPDRVITGDPAFLLQLDNSVRSAARGEAVQWTAQQRAWLDWVRRLTSNGRGDDLFKLFDWESGDKFQRIFSDDFLDNLQRAFRDAPPPGPVGPPPPLPGARPGTATGTGAAGNPASAPPRNQPIRDPDSDPFARTGPPELTDPFGAGARRTRGQPVDPLGKTRLEGPPGSPAAGVAAGVSVAGAAGASRAGASEPGSGAESRLSDSDTRRLADVRQRLASSSDPEDQKLLTEINEAFAGVNVTAATLRLNDADEILGLDPLRFSGDAAKGLDAPPAATTPLGLLPNLPGVVPLSGDSSLASVRLAMDQALRQAGLDMAGTFRTDAANGAVIYTDGEVRVTGRASGGGVLLDAAVDDGPVNTVGQHFPPAIAPIEFTVLPGMLPADAGTSIDVDVEEDLISINDPSVMHADADGVVQLMIAVFGGDDRGVLVVEPSPATGRPLVSKAARRVLGVLAALTPLGRGIAAQRASPLASAGELTGGTWLAPLSQGTRSRSGAGGHPVRMVLTSLGGSTGEVFQAQLINDGTVPVKLSGSLVIEPIKKEAQAAVQRQLQRAVAPGRGVTAKLAAYCLEFLRVPPSAGTLFRIAPPELQRKFAPVRRILDASNRLRQAGLLTPDSDPASYFHSIAQWAIWSREQKFTLESFQRAFIDHASKNVKASGRQWTKQFEEVLRGIVPGRWQQITAVLAEAERGGTYAPR